MNIKVKTSELKAANIVAGNADIISVRLIRCLVENRIPPVVGDDFKVSYKFEWGTDGYGVPSPGILISRIWLKIQFGDSAESGEAGLEKSSDASKRCAEIELRYEITYSIPKEPIPAEIEQAGGLAPFSKWNGLYNCWPYFRQEVTRLCIAAELPPLMLPLVRLVPAD